MQRSSRCQSFHCWYDSRANKLVVYELIVLYLEFHSIPQICYLCLHMLPPMRIILWRRKQKTEESQGGKTPYSQK